MDKVISKAALHGMYVVDNRGKIIGRLSFSVMASQIDSGDKYLFICSDNLSRRGSNAKLKFGYKYSYALYRSRDIPSVQKIDGFLRRKFNLNLADNPITLYDLL